MSKSSNIIYIIQILRSMNSKISHKRGYPLDYYCYLCHDKMNYLEFCMFLEISYVSIDNATD